MIKPVVYHADTGERLGRFVKNLSLFDEWPLMTSHYVYTDLKGRQKRILKFFAEKRYPNS